MNTRKITLFLSIMLSCAFIFAQTAEYKYQAPKNYIGVKNTGVNMTLGIPETSWEVIPQIGDEIGAFNSIGQLVGSTVFLGGNSAITIWGDDETTMEKEGVADKGKFILRLWNSSNSTESNLEITNWIEGDDVYATNAISVIGKIKSTTFSQLEDSFSLMQNNPNPAQTATSIMFYLPYATQSSIIVYSQDGKVVGEKHDANLSEGMHELRLDVSEFAAGTYFYKLQTSEFSAVKSMTVIK